RARRACFLPDCSPVAAPSAAGCPAFGPWPLGAAVPALSPPGCPAGSTPDDCSAPTGCFFFRVRREGVFPTASPVAAASVAGCPALGPWAPEAAVPAPSPPDWPAGADSEPLPFFSRSRRSRRAIRSARRVSAVDCEPVTGGRQGYWPD